MKELKLIENKEKIEKDGYLQRFNWRQSSYPFERLYEAVLTDEEAKKAVERGYTVFFSWNTLKKTKDGYKVTIFSRYDDEYYSSNINRTLSFLKRKAIDRDEWNEDTFSILFKV